MKAKHKLNQLLNNKDNKEILNKGFSFFVLRIGGLFAGYLFTLVVAKYYGASEVGLVSLCFTLIMCTSIFGRLGIDVNLITHFSQEENTNDSGLFFKVLIKAIIFSSILALLIFILKDTIALKIFKKPQLEPYFLWIVLTIPLWTVVLICAGLFRSFKKSSLFAFFNNPGRFFFSLIALLLFIVLFKDTPLIAIKAHFFGVLCLAILSIVLSLKQFKTITYSSKSNTWLFLRQAFPMMLSGAIIVFLGWADTFVLGIYETDKTIGIYNVALKIAMLTSFSLQAINAILAPKISKFYRENDLRSMRQVIKFSTRVNFVITTFIVVFILLTSNYILSFFGNEFLAGSALLFLLCIGQLINSLSGSVGLIMQMIGLQKVYQNIVFVALIINITLNFILTPIYGATGAAVATIVSIAFWNIYSALYLKQKKNIISYFRF